MEKRCQNAPKVGGYAVAFKHIALLSLWAIANAETLIGQEFSKLVYVA
jgi:hypothetical protein